VPRRASGIDRLKGRLRDRRLCSPANAGSASRRSSTPCSPDLVWRVREVSDVQSEGKAYDDDGELLRLDSGGWVVDTPGSASSLWDIIPEEVEGFLS